MDRSADTRISGANNTYRRTGTYALQHRKPYRESKNPF